jgi:hypothetical protein
MRKRWTTEELNNLGSLLDKRILFSEISKSLNRTIAGIKLVIYRKVRYKPRCLSCGQRIYNRKGPRLRCEWCAIQRNKQRKKEYNRTEERKDWARQKRDQERCGGLRERVIRRDGGKCVSCKMTRDHHISKFGKDITVTHKDGKGRYSSVKNNDLKNLVTLCLPCQGKMVVIYRQKDWSMCVTGLIKYQQDRKGFRKVKNICVSCSKKFKNNSTRFAIKGNFCDGCGKSSNQEIREIRKRLVELGV